jgi:hypothetical protein
MSLNKMISEKGELMRALGEIKILSSDLGIFLLWISSVRDKNNTPSIYFVGVAGAESGGA